MTNISLPFSGGTVKLPYEIGDCEGEKNIRFEKDTADTWYEMGSGVTFITVTCPATTESRTGSITPYFNDVACETISVSQRGESVCDCSALSNVDFNYIIPASGAASGTVVGTYTLNGGCVDSVTVTADLGLEILAQGGKFTLNKDVPQNPRSDEMIEYALTVKYNEEACVNDTIVQEASGVECSCEGITKIVHSVHRYFSNLGNEEHPGDNYTNLQNVLIASATTACGEFKADAKNSTMLSDVVSGQTVGEDKVLMVREGNNIYAYVTVLENPNPATQRSTAIDLYFRKKEESGYTYCNGKALYLYQSPADYTACEYVMSFKDDCQVFGNTYTNFLGLGYCIAVEYDVVSFLGPNFYLNSQFRHCAIKYKVSEIGYVIGSLSLAENVDACDPSNKTNVVYISSADDLEQVTDIDINDWVEYEYYNNGSYGQGIRIKFKTANESDRHRYVKLDIHAYTDYDYRDQYSGKDCGVVASQYIVQMCSVCTECGSMYYHMQNVDASGYTWERYDYFPTNLCRPYTIKNITLNPQDAGEISLIQEEGKIVACDLVIYPNHSGSEREITLSCEVELANGNICTAKGYFKQPYEICSNCDEIKNAIQLLGNSKGSDNYQIDCSNPPSPSYSYTGEANTWVSVLMTVARWKQEISAEICDKDKVYVVWCDENGENEFLPTSVTPSLDDCYEICEGNKLFYHYDYVIGKGQLMKKTTYGTALYGYFYYTGGTQIANLSVYYKVKIYEDDVLLCETEVRSYKNAEEIGGCIEPSCYGVIDNGVGFYGGTKIVTINGELNVVLPKDGSATSCFTMRFENGAEIDSEGGRYCTGYTKHYSITTQEEGVAVTINGTTVIVSAPANDSETYATYTLDVNFWIEDSSGNITVCPNYARTLYFAVDYE